MNTAVHASPPTESKQHARSERDLSIQLPRAEELLGLSLAQRMALRVAVHLIIRSRRVAQDQARSALAEARGLRVLQQYEADRLAHNSIRQVL